MEEQSQSARRRQYTIDADIAQLMADKGVDANDEYLAAALDALLKLGADQAVRGDVKIVSRAVREMRYAFKIFAGYRGLRKVSIFGSARTRPDHPAYKAGVAFGREMAARGWMAITGAGSGIMQAGNEGAGAAHSFGLAIRLPFEQHANEFIANDPKLIVFRHFFTRKLFFVKEAHAICLMPGGFGTHDEGFEVLTLIQTGKASPLPIVMLDEPGGTYWKVWEEFVRKDMLERNYLGAEDLSLFKITDSVEEAVAEVLRFYRRYHSSRYVAQDWVVRLNSPMPQESIDQLSKDFGELLSAPIRLSPPLAQEADEPNLAHLPRLIVPLKAKNFGRLRQLIDAINDCGD